MPQDELAVLRLRVKALEDEVEHLRLSAEGAFLQAEKYAKEASQLELESEQALALLKAELHVTKEMLGASEEAHELAKGQYQASTSELRNANEEMQVLSEELVASNQKLQLSTKELEAINEELHTTNEELGVSNEEIHATAEQLEIVNEKLLASNRDLFESDERFRKLFQNDFSAGIVINDAGIIELINAAAEKVFKYKSVEVIGKNVSVLMPEPERSNHDQYIQNYLDTGKAGIIGSGREVTGLRKDGEEFPMRLGINKFEVAGKTAFIGSIFDLSDTKLLEKKYLQAQKMEALGQLTGGIAHDFNNVLGAIMLNLEMLDMHIAEDPVCSRYLSGALASVKRAATLTSRLVSFSGKQHLQIEELDINSKIRDFLPMLRRTIPENINISTRLSADLWPTTIDLSQLENTILNLVLNARDAMASGGSLVIETANAMLEDHHLQDDLEAEPGDYVRLTFTDDGSGMSKEVLSHILEPFFTTKEQGKGTGLGLSMVYGFVYQSNGFIDVQSTIGEGTCFNIYFPRAVAAAAPLDKKLEKQNLELGTGCGEVILVVEDSLGVQEVVVTALERMGYKPHAVSSGRDALSWLKVEANKADLLLSDIVLPGNISGINIAQHVRTRLPETKIILMSGYSEISTKEFEQFVPRLPLLKKPFTTAALAMAVAQELSASINKHQTL